MNKSRAAITCGRSKISSVNPVSAPSASAMIFTGMLMLTIDTARVNHLLDVFEVVPDLFSFRDAVDDRRQTDGEVGCNRPGRWGLWHG